MLYRPFTHQCHQRNIVILTCGLDNIEEQAADDQRRQHRDHFPVAVLRRAHHDREPHAYVEGRAHEQDLDRLEVQLGVAE